MADRYLCVCLKKHWTLPPLVKLLRSLDMQTQVFALRTFFELAHDFEIAEELVLPQVASDHDFLANLARLLESHAPRLSKLAGAVWRVIWDLDNPNDRTYQARIRKGMDRVGAQAWRDYQQRRKEPRRLGRRLQGLGFSAGLPSTRSLGAVHLD